MSSIFIDESGYSGDNLLDPAQPYYCVASVRVGEDHANNLLAKYFGGTQADEVKFSSIRRSGKQQGATLQLLNEIIAQEIKIEIYIAYKPFALLLKAVDWLVEPALQRHGINIYRDGMMLSYGNAMWYCLSAGSDPTLNQFLGLFQQAVLQPSDATFQLFSNFVEATACRHELGGEFLHPIVETIRAEGAGCCTDLPKFPLDLSVTTVSTLLQRWRHRTPAGQTIHLVHDESTHMAAQGPYLDFLLAAGRTPYNQNVGKRGAIFPINCTYEFANSKSSKAIQLADVLAGMFATSLQYQLTKICSFSRTSEAEELVRLCGQLGADQVVIMAPSSAIGPDATGKKDIDYNEMLNYLTHESIQNS